MVRIVPNWAHVRGVVLDVADVGDESGYLRVSLRLAAVAPVPGERNLLREGPGEPFDVLMAREVIDRLGVRPGVELDADVRRADLTRSFVHPERVRVEPAGPGEDVQVVREPDPHDDVRPSEEPS